MFSLSIFAQLIRWSLLLVVTWLAVPQCQPLMEAFALHATSGGCHQQNSPDHQHSEYETVNHQHMGHH